MHEVGRAAAPMCPGARFAEPLGEVRRLAIHSQTIGSDVWLSAIRSGGIPAEIFNLYGKRVEHGCS